MLQDLGIETAPPLLGWVFAEQWADENREATMAGYGVSEWYAFTLQSWRLAPVCFDTRTQRKLIRGLRLPAMQAPFKTVEPLRNAGKRARAQLQGLVLQQAECALA